GDKGHRRGSATLGEPGDEPHEEISDHCQRVRVNRPAGVLMSPVWRMSTVERSDHWRSRSYGAILGAAGPASSPVDAGPALSGPPAPAPQPSAVGWPPWRGTSTSGSDGRGSPGATAWR